MTLSVFEGYASIASFTSAIFHVCGALCGASAFTELFVC